MTSKQERRSISAMGLISQSNTETLSPMEMVPFCRGEELIVQEPKQPSYKKNQRLIQYPLAPRIKR